MKTARKQKTYSVAEALKLLEDMGYTRVIGSFTIATMKTRCGIYWDVSAAGKEYYKLRWSHGKYKGNQIVFVTRPDHH
jgi:hypothetical protein